MQVAFSSTAISVGRYETGMTNLYKQETPDLKVLQVAGQSWF